MEGDPCPLVARARALIGVPFRLQGRATDGLDYVGLVAAVFGLSEVAPRSYALRGTDACAAEGALDRHFQRRRSEDPQAGDVLLLRAGPAQLHLGIWTGAAMVHAHAGLRRVVETPGWPEGLIGLWYLKER